MTTTAQTVFFTPEYAVISAITNANPGVVTTTTNHNFLTGLYVRLVFPAPYGMPQVANQVFLITVLSPTTFSINIDTSLFYPFINVVTTQSPQAIPVGEVAETLLGAEKNGLMPIAGI